MPNPHPNTKGLRPPFKKGESGNPKGRPPNRVPGALKIILGKKKSKAFYKLSLLEVNEWEAAVMTMTIQELKLLANWEDANSYAKGLSISILVDMKNGNTKTLDKLRDRQFGRAVQKLELTGKDGEPLSAGNPITPEDARELISSLNEEC